MRQYVQKERKAAVRHFGRVPRCDLWIGANYSHFSKDITVLDKPPDGFYVLIAASNEMRRADILNADVIAGWLLINRSLSVNGYQVINGYSDLLTPFLAIAGATAVATGWWQNSRLSSLDRFLPAGGGRLPIPRYLSKVLLNRITHIEVSKYHPAKALTQIPNVLNGLETDYLYPSDQDTNRRELTKSYKAGRQSRACAEICPGRP